MNGFQFRLKVMDAWRGAAATGVEKVALARVPFPEWGDRDITTFLKKDIGPLKHALDLFILNNPTVFAVDGSLRPVKARKTFTIEYDENLPLKWNLPDGARLVLADESDSYASPFGDTRAPW